MKSNFFQFLIPRKDLIFMDNIIKTQYNGSDYIIEFTRTSKNYIFSNNYHYICTISIFDKIHTPITEIKCNEVDIIRLLDTLYYAIDNNMETYSFISSIDLIGNYFGLKLELSFNQYTFETEYNLCILKYNKQSEIIAKLAKIHFNTFSEIYNFLDLLYYTFLVDNINMTDYKDSFQEYPIYSDEFYQSINGEI